MGGFMNYKIILKSIIPIILGILVLSTSCYKDDGDAIVTIHFKGNNIAANAQQKHIIDRILEFFSKPAYAAWNYPCNRLTLTISGRNIQEQFFDTGNISSGITDYTFTASVPSGNDVTFEVLSYNTNSNKPNWGGGKIVTLRPGNQGIDIAMIPMTEITNLASIGNSVTITLDNITQSYCTGYNIYRSTEANSNYQLIGYIANATGTLSYIDNSVNNYMTYYYRISAINSNGTEGLLCVAGLITIGIVPPYIITGSGAIFTATKNGATIGTPDQPIQDVIDDIKTDSAGEDCAIQFGNGAVALDIGTSMVDFNGTGSPGWGKITLLGKITSANTTSTQGTIYLQDSVAIDIKGEIANTANTGCAVYNSSTGKITISGTALVTSATTINTTATIYLASSGIATAVRLEITGGTVENTASDSTNNPRAIINNSTGAINISGGTVSGDCAIGSTGEINISGGTVFARTYIAIALVSNALNISGGTVSSAGVSGKGYAITCTTGSIVNISGGTVSTTGGGYAIYSENSGKITVSGTALVTSVSTMGTIVFLLSGGTELEITGGTVENTANSGRAIYNNSTGPINISGGTISATGTGGYAIYNGSSGVVDITSPPAVIIGSTYGSNINWY